MNLLATLVDKGFLSAADRTSVENDLLQKRPLADVLAKRGVSLETALAEIGKDYNLPSLILGDPPANEDVFQYVPIDSAKHYGFVPLKIEEGVLYVGLVDPDNIGALDALQFIANKTGLPYKLFLITRNDFNRVIEAYENLSGEVGEALTEYETKDKSISQTESPQIQSALSEESLVLTGPHETLKEDAPITKIVSTILRYAIDGHSSDVHIEPSPTKTRVRFREDGDLHTSIELPQKVHEAVIARIKILAKLRLDERRKPQDGRFSATAGKRRIDFRISTFPTEFGEKVVMRILDQSDSTVTIESIGLSAAQLEEVRSLIQAPYGIILIAGPTGSGKSTTLFTMLSELDREKYNVVSLEDPIEYEIKSVSQSQVRPEIGYTFATGLRHILRQDPDIIMVGEIRDKETAVLAVQAALTGHLVFSTIHTNTAAGAIPRLIDIGVDPFLIAPTLVSVIGQRLVRKLCAGAGRPFPINDSLREMLNKQFADLPERYRKGIPPFKEFYRAEATADCPNGTRGRMGVFEILRVTKDIERCVLKEPVEEKIYGIARAQGMLSMREDAIIKALQGTIPFEEVNTLGGDIFSMFDEGDSSVV